MKTFFPPESLTKKSRSVKRELQRGLEDLFEELGLTFFIIDDCLDLSTTSFIKDLLRVLDEIKNHEDIVNTWKIPDRIACQIFAVIIEILSQPVEEFECEEDSDTSDDDDGLYVSDSGSSSSDTYITDNEDDQMDDFDCSNSEDNDD